MAWQAVLRRCSGYYHARSSSCAMCSSTERCYASGHRAPAAAAALRRRTGDRSCQSLVGCRASTLVCDGHGSHAENSTPQNQMTDSSPWTDVVGPNLQAAHRQRCQNLGSCQGNTSASNWSLRLSGKHVLSLSPAPRYSALRAPRYHTRVPLKEAACARAVYQVALIPDLHA